MNRPRPAPLLAPVAVWDSRPVPPRVRLPAWLLATTCAGLLTAAGCQRDTPAPPTPAEEPLQKVTAGRLPHKTLRVVSTQPARIAAYQRTPLTARIPGYVGEVLVDIGDRVQQGQELLRLAVPELHDELHQTEALVAHAEAEVKQAEAAAQVAAAALALAEAKRAQMQAGVAKAQAALTQAKQELERIGKLAAEGSLSQKLVDESRSRLQTAEAGLAEAESVRIAVEAEVKHAQAEIVQADADRLAAVAKQRVATAKHDEAHTMLGYATLTAPYAGTITSRQVDPGHYVSGAGGPALLVLAQTGTVRVQVDVPEVEAGLVDNGDPATVRVQALRDKVFDGRIARTSWSLHEDNRSLQVEIDLPNDQGELRPGMFAVAQLQLAEAVDALALPAAGVVRDGSQTFACVVRDGKIVRQPIQLGLRSGDEWQVADGLQDDDLVVLARADGLRAGQAVQAVEPPKP